MKAGREAPSNGVKALPVDHFGGITLGLALQFAIMDEPLNGSGEVLARLQHDMANLREALACSA
jgi:hypothetical protein